MAGSQPAVASKKRPWMYETIWSFSTLGVQRRNRSNRAGHNPIGEVAWEEKNIQFFRIDWKFLRGNVYPVVSLGEEKRFVLWEENIFNDFSFSLW